MIKTGIVLLVVGLGYWFYAVFSIMGASMGYTDGPRTTGSSINPLYGYIALGAIFLGLMLLILGMIDYFKKNKTK